MRIPFRTVVTVTLATSAIVLGTFALSNTAAAINASNYAPDASIAGSAGLPTSDQSPSQIILNGIRVFMQVLGLIALVLILYAGFTMLTSGGNSEKIGQAKNILIWTAIGAAVILSSLGILEYIDAVFYGT